MPRALCVLILFKTGRETQMARNVIQRNLTINICTPLPSYWKISVGAGGPALTLTEWTEGLV